MTGSATRHWANLHETEIYCIDETQKFTKTDSQLHIDPDLGASLTALRP